MISSNSNVNGPKYPKFALIVAFDYYDGPESGLAVSTTGAGVRFSSVGDSKYRFQRGFEMEAIEGDWWPPVRELVLEEGESEPRRVFAPRPSQILAKLEERVAQATVTEHFVAVGSPDLLRLTIVSATDAEITELRERSRSGDGFRFAKALVRSRRS